MKEKTKPMSFWGIGPRFVIISLVLILPMAYCAWCSRTVYTISFVPVLFYIFGGLFVVIGLWLWIDAGSQIDGYIRQGVLANKGIYGIVRHPVYAGIFFVIAGIFIVSRSILLIPLILPVYIILVLLLRCEECSMYQAFGDQYRDYKKEVNSIFPRLCSMKAAFFYPEKSRKVSEHLYVIQSQDANFYVYTDGQELVCFDTGYDEPFTKDVFEELGLDLDSVSAVFLTHSDIDHQGGLKYFKKAELFMGREEQKLIDHSVSRLACFYKNRKISRSFQLLNDNDVVRLGNIRVQAFETPGHTIGHTCYLVDDKYLFTGDSIVLQNRRLLPFYRLLSMDHDATVSSAEKIKKMKQAQWLCTGHTGIDTTKHYCQK